MRQIIKRSLIFPVILNSTNNRDRTLEAFGSFMDQLISDNPSQALMVNGFFCGLLAKNMSLSDEEVSSLVRKYSYQINSKLSNKKE